MRPTRLSRPIRRTQLACIYPFVLNKALFLAVRRSCSSCPPIYFSATGALHAYQASNPGPIRGKQDPSKNIESPEEAARASDHRTIGTAQSLFTTHSSSPGAPFFHPDGTHILNKLAAFLRAQYPTFGFREVLTPTMYKQSLWERSGHWANYKDDMFTVTGNPSYRSQAASVEFSDGRIQPRKPVDEAAELEEFGLKPMNCPGHCLLFQSQRRSYRDLPIRYADFSPLHRNEISGALSGLTRVRRFHQDDGHIFCRPIQVEIEISNSLDFVELVYKTLGFKDYRLVLSTRPEKKYIGTVGEWNRAEDQLKRALKASGKQWRTRAGDGAFYGPKIDVIVQDSDGKQHQTGTIQLDFQLPKRFDLGYEAPAPELEARGERTLDSGSLQTMGSVTPVMIHRAVLGSLERFMALLLEYYQGQLPFWLSPRQITILTVTDRHPIISHVQALKRRLLNWTNNNLPKAIHHRSYVIDVDDSGDSIAQKIVRARKKQYNLICIVGAKNLADKKLEGQSTLDLTVAYQPNKLETWNIIEKIKPGSQAPIRKDRGVGANFGGESSGVRLTVDQFDELISTLDEQYL